MNVAVSYDPCLHIFSRSISLHDLLGDSIVIFISPGNTTLHHKCNTGLHHLAFSVGTHEEIDTFYSKIVGFYASHPNHGHILDTPALYPEYGLHYYA